MTPYPFGENTAWFAFKTTDVDRVRQLFFADEWRPVGWEEGVRASYESPDEHGFARVLVTPPIDGYVLATTCGFLGWSHGGELILPQVRKAGDLAMRAGEWASELEWDIQFYASERHIDLYEWGRHRCGDEFDELDAYRHFAVHESKLLVSSGKISLDERALADAFIRSEKSPFFVAEVREELERLAEARQLPVTEAAGTGQPEPERISAEDLTTIAALLVGGRTGEVAARWSFDPDALDMRPDAHLIPTTCWLGRIFL